MNSILEFFKNLFAPKPPPRPDNTGVILDQKPEDYVVGANSPIPYLERLKDGNWQPYAFDEEVQWCMKNGQYVDQFSCVTQSAINIIEAQEFFLTGKKVHYSKRWIAKMSGTTKEGNTLSKVADTIRKFGLVLEEDYPTPASYTWDEFYAPIPQDKLDWLKLKGQAWLKSWNVAYEFLSVSDWNLDVHLKHSPIQCVIPGHAIAGIFSPDQLMTILDSYSPHIKKYSVSGLQAAMKLILTQKTIQARQIGWQGSPELGVYIPADSMQRFEFIKEHLAEWLPDYQLDTTRTYAVEAKKPTWG